MIFGEIWLEVSRIRFCVSVRWAIDSLPPSAKRIEFLAARYCALSSSFGSSLETAIIIPKIVESTARTDRTLTSRRSLSFLSLRFGRAPSAVRCGAGRTGGGLSGIGVVSCMPSGAAGPRV